jgi:hypothetical protein
VGAQDKPVPVEWELRANVARLSLSPEQQSSLVPQILAVADDMGDGVPSDVVSVVQQLRMQS